MSKNSLVLTVGNDPTSQQLLCQRLVTEGYNARMAASPEEVNGIVRDARGIGLVLVDISGFDRRIWLSCRRLHEAKIPFFVVAPERSATVQRESMASGADAVFVKPGIQKLLEFVTHRLS